MFPIGPIVVNDQTLKKYSSNLVTLAFLKNFHFANISFRKLEGFFHEASV